MSATTPRPTDYADATVSVLIEAWQRHLKALVVDRHSAEPGHTAGHALRMLAVAEALAQTPHRNAGMRPPHDEV